MNLSPADLGHALLTLSVLLLAAHGVGFLFQRWRQPPVIGEIVGGILLGPTCLELLWPAGYVFIFEASAAAQVFLGGIYQLGLQLLMFCSGMEIRGEFKLADRTIALWLAGAGTVLPFAFSFAALPFFGITPHLGPAGSATAFTLVFAIAIAVTSIPVISRILADLGILSTRFARIVLTAAVLEDVVLYVVLAVAVSLAAGAPHEAFGLLRLLNWSPESIQGLAYHVAVTLGFFGLTASTGPSALQRLERQRFNFAWQRSPLAYLLSVFLVFTLCAVALGIAPMLGAFAAGIAVGRLQGPKEEAARSIRQFSFGFFVPVYFAIVGLRLDLIHDFHVLSFSALLLLACGAKLASVFLGARLAGETPARALNFAVAMNARGGPGIVLATVALDASIINRGFYTSLILLAIVTSLLAGSWLQRELRRGQCFE
jgi:Kef-type K+ transport system membrane component KefB